ncbi:MAG: hypothetical protein ABI687_00800 [Flavitalea sp.]
MRIFTLLSFFIIVVIGSLNAQSYAKMIKYKDGLKPSLYLPLTNKTETTEQTILAKLKETGYKPETKGRFFWKNNKQDGFYVFPGVQLPELNNRKLDLYFKVEGLNGDSSYNSAISLLVSKGYDNFVAPDTDSATYAASEHFLNSFVTETAEFSVNKKIEDQKKKISESEKKWQEVRSKQDDARKKIAQLESDIKNLQDDEAKQQQDVEFQRKTLQDLETQRMDIKK